MKHYKFTSDTSTIDSRGIAHSRMDSAKNRDSIERRLHIHCLRGLQIGDGVRKILLCFGLRVCLWIAGQLRFFCVTHAHDHNRCRFRRGFRNADFWRENQLEIRNRKNTSFLHLQIARRERLYRAIRRLTQLVLSDDLEEFQSVCLTEVAIESVQLQTHADDLR